MRRAFTVLVALGSLIAACTKEADGPSKGTYTIDFPSTAAAVATDFVQVLVFDVPDVKSRATLCEDLITARATDPTTLQTAVPPAAATNICEMLKGQRLVSVPYGEHALLAIAQRKDPSGTLTDFMIGCAIMTVGEGNAPLPISVSLVNIGNPVPATTCGSVGEFCANKCN